MKQIQSSKIPQGLDLCRAHKISLENSDISIQKYSSEKYKTRSLYQNPKSTGHFIILMVRVIRKEK